MEKKVTIGEKEYTLKEISYVEAISINPNKREETVRKLLKLSADLSDEEINKLTLREGLELQKQINELNGLTQDFTVPIKKE